VSPPSTLNAKGQLLAANASTGSRGLSIRRQAGLPPGQLGQRRGLAVERIRQGPQQPGPYGRLAAGEASGRLRRRAQQPVEPFQRDIGPD
jgi:hypothetical protein